RHRLAGWVPRFRQPVERDPARAAPPGRRRVARRACAPGSGNEIPPAPEGRRTVARNVNRAPGLQESEENDRVIGEPLARVAGRRAEERTMSDTSISRRGFLQSSAVAVTGVALGAEPERAAGAPVAQEKTLRWGIIGTGARCRHHIAAIKSFGE